MTNVLWTGGWDSTFRILDLTIMKSMPVQPVYVMDGQRPSASKEMEVMGAIRAMISQVDSEAGALIADTIIFHQSEIPQIASIKSAYLSLRKHTNLGSQYEWLASLATWKDLDFDLGIEGGGKIHGLLRNDLCRVDLGGDAYYELRQNPSDPDLELFSRFRFPIIQYTKLEMEDIARSAGVGHILEATWFCFTPTRKGTPCGSCNPCRDARKKGQGRRVPAKPLALLWGLDRKLTREFKKLRE